MSNPNKHFDDQENRDLYDAAAHEYYSQSSSSRPSSAASRHDIRTIPSMIPGQAPMWDPNAAYSVSGVIHGTSMPHLQAPQASFSDLMREIGNEHSVALQEVARRAPYVRSMTGTSSAAMPPPSFQAPRGPGSSPPLSRSSSISGSTTGWQHMHQSSSDDATFEMFPCDFCSASFSRRHDLERHRRGHSGEAPYVCEGCGAAFTRSDGRGRHWKLQPQCEQAHFQRGGGGKRRSGRSGSGSGSGPSPSSDGGSAQAQTGSAAR